MIILGSTGSIGVQTLEVIDRLNAGLDPDDPGRFEVVGLSANRNAATLAEQAEAWPNATTALAAPPSELPASLSGVMTGLDAAERLVRETEAEIVVASIVGVAGLRSTLAAVELGLTVALANKETLVAAGSIVMAEAAQTGARIHPVDSEHAAAWLAMRSVCGLDYCPPALAPAVIERLTLTASGGAFRDRTLAEIQNATPEEALKHPNWDMGAKVTIDSATLTNKALELVEAHWLFGLDSDRLAAVIHPQSAVHAIVELRDGASIAQLAPPDMRIPIAQSLTAPGLAPHDRGPRLDLAAMGRLDFEAPDPERWPAIASAMTVIDRGGGAGAVFNAANEVAVEAFLAGRIPFGSITELGSAALHEVDPGRAESIEDLFDADGRARRFVEERIAAHIA